MAMKLAVLRGGRSAEREVSLRSGAQVEEALRGLGHEVLGVDIDATTWDTLRDGGFACVFNALHGRLGEDGAVQGMLELLGLPYTGSGILASALCMDKSRANSVMAGAGLHIPDFEELEIKEGVGADVVERLVSRFGLPIVVKPVREGSTIGLTKPRAVWRWPRATTAGCWCRGSWWGPRSPSACWRLQRWRCCRLWRS